MFPFSLFNIVDAVAVYTCVQEVARELCTPPATCTHWTVRAVNHTVGADCRTASHRVCGHFVKDPPDKTVNSCITDDYRCASVQCRVHEHNHTVLCFLCILLQIIIMYVLLDSDLKLVCELSSGGGSLAGSARFPLRVASCVLKSVTSQGAGAREKRRRS